MYHFDPYNVFLVIATNITQRVKTGFVLQSQIYIYIYIYIYFILLKEIIEINTFIKQGSFKLIKRDDKDIYNVTKDFYFRKMLFFSTFY